MMGVSGGGAHDEYVRGGRVSGRGARDEYVRGGRA